VTQDPGRHTDVTGPASTPRIAANILYDPYLCPGSPAGPPGQSPADAGHGIRPDGARQACDAPKQRQPRQRWLFFLTALGFLSLLCSSAIFAWGIHHWRELLSQTPSAQPAKGEGTKEAAHPAGDDKAKANAPAASAAAPTTKVPESTQSTQLGTIEIVDIGLASIELKEALLAQAKLARNKGQTLLLMVTGTDCAPCRGVDISLADPLLQQGLRNVRLVRVDLRVFKEELAALKLQTNVYPVFALLAADLSLRDAIHGGEWDEDIAANIGPVLRDFVRGQYNKRRHPDWTPTTGGMQL
jgi:hypothetical protein